MTSDAEANDDSAWCVNFRSAYDRWRHWSTPVNDDDDWHDAHDRRETLLPHHSIRSYRHRVRPVIKLGEDNSTSGFQIHLIIGGGGGGGEGGCGSSNALYITIMGLTLYEQIFLWIQTSRGLTWKRIFDAKQRIFRMQNVSSFKLNPKPNDIVMFTIN